MAEAQYRMTSEEMAAAVALENDLDQMEIDRHEKEKMRARSMPSGRPYNHPGYPGWSSTAIFWHYKTDEQNFEGFMEAALSMRKHTKNG